MDTIDRAWVGDAACAEADTELFYPVTREIFPEVVAICGGCPVRAECFAYALEHEEHGVWAATSPEQRQRLRRRAGIVLRTPGLLLAMREALDQEAS